MLHTRPEMTTRPPARCPRCGSTIPPHAAQGLCPACLLGSALAPGDGLERGNAFPYRIVTLLAGDAGAVTYLAHTMSGAPRYVALKVLLSCREPDAILARFDRWKRALAELRHPSAAPIVDAGRVDSASIYLAADYVAGSPLRPILDGLTRDDRADIVRQLDAALRAAHDRGLAHLRLDASRIKIATTAGLRAVMLGLGAALVVDGAAPDPAPDREALARLAHDFGVPAPG